ncbi:alpha-N-acetylglucosaminidase [Arenibacter nanhaiticus]|uniref:Alpha-N-acetylglucosaminidase n=1 Tax=Arenibacter nanhaiticus TaxID=558155 RepID=A0A1M6CE30_9FLAO|nr:alpha-N-acetylglucosaminidase [Arenibacter nanhaiticus]SHI59081.1 alpha-N-acetylglucosaminidase [Arenibacter nanhaiticus]
MFRLQIISLLLIVGSCNAYKDQSPEELAAQEVLNRTLGEEDASKFIFKYTANDSLDTYTIKVKNNKVLVSGNSPTALTRGAYDYLKNATNSMISWSGKNINIPEELPEVEKTSTSPYKNRYYLNVCAFGYSTPYWDWKRWEQEIDWMALKGMNFPLALVANEAIATRVWKKLGLTQDEIDAFYTAPSLLPWQRMGNVNDLGGELLTEEWHNGQIALQHKILKRMKELNMNPILPSFAGFVPKDISRLFPENELLPVSWGGFPDKHQGFLISPKTPLFDKIGKLFIEEWEREFGKGKYYLADSFNEMDLPKTDRPVTELLAEYGSSIYESLKSGNPDAVWVVQGWMFTYQRNIWNKETTNALFSKIPDDKLMILDYAYEYNGIAYKNGFNYDVFEGYNNKPWVYGFMLNSGGKTGHTGVHDYYATNPIELLKSPYYKSNTGFGFAPEGIENNEVTFELVSDMAWTSEAIDLDNWYVEYAKGRYGAAPTAMAEAWQLLRKTSYGTMTDHPRFGFQGNSGSWSTGTINKDPRIFEAIEKFLSCSEELKDSELYKADALEFAATALCHKAEDWFGYAYNAHQKSDFETRDKAGEWALQLLTNADRLLENHPTLNLQRWIDFARATSTDTNQQDKYEEDARRILTVWGPPKLKLGVNDYAARMWGGLIRDYYRERMAGKLESLRLNETYDHRTFEDAWVRNKGVSKIEPFKDPLESARKLVKQAIERPVPVIVNEDGIVVGEWSSKDNTMEWPINRADLPKIKEVKFIYTSGNTPVSIKNVTLIADGKPLYENSKLGFLDRENATVVYPLGLPKGVRANNGASLKVAISSNDEEIPAKGKAVLILED